jgi:WS/DGAT/MGAT family acyltransferase
MIRLSGLDGAFLAMESPTTHLHIMGLLILDPTDVPGGLTFQRIRRLVADRVPLVPPFRQRLVDMAFGLQHPVLVDDPDFDLDAHVRRHSIPSPGGRAELEALVADLASRPLDRHRPLWEFHVVEDLEQGRVAVVAKVHHAIIDGVAGTEVLGAFLDLTPDSGPRPLFSAERPPRRSEAASQQRPTGDADVQDRPATPGWSPAPLPGEMEQLRSTLGAIPGQMEAVGRSLATTFQAVLARSERNHEHRPTSSPSPFDAPTTSFNRAISARRRVATVELPLGDLRRVGESLGGTINEVVLAVVAGALRDLLAARNEEPATSLVAMVPVSVRTEDEGDQLGNRVTGTLVSLATGVIDPATRLQQIRVSAGAAKEQARTSRGEVLAAWADAVAPGVANQFARLLSGLRVFDHVRPPCNVVVSNVPGPDVPLYLAGARLVSVHPIGPIAEGVGLNITVFTYADTVHIGVNGCWDLVPDIATLATSFELALADLVAAAARKARKVPWWHAELPA